MTPHSVRQYLPGFLPVVLLVSWLSVFAAPARAQDGRRYVSAGDFSVAPAALRSQAEALRPGQGTPVSERVAFAAWLEQMELRDEARRYWKALVAERPNDARLRGLAAE